MNSDEYMIMQYSSLLHLQGLEILTRRYFRWYERPRISMLTYCIIRVKDIEKLFITNSVLGLYKLYLTLYAFAILHIRRIFLVFFYIRILNDTSFSWIHQQILKFVCLVGTFWMSFWSLEIITYHSLAKQNCSYHI